MLHHSSVGQVHVEECYIMFTYTFLAFFICFSSKQLRFYHFHFFFWYSIKFPQQNINQSETGIGDKKLSLELHESEDLRRNGNESDDDAFQYNCNSDGEEDQDGEVEFSMRKMNEGTFPNRNWIPCQTRGKGNLFHWKKIKSANAREA